MRNFVLAAGIGALTLAGCGGGGSSGSGSPAVTLGPSPAPTSSPAPSPTPSPTPPGDSGGGLLGGGIPPVDLEGPAICSSAPVTRAGGRVADVSLGTLTVVPFHIFTTDGRSYETEFNGFGGPVYAASARITGQAFEIFVSASDEFQLIKRPAPLEFATLGLATGSPDLCFYAAAPRTTLPPPSAGQTSYTGLVDGLHQAGGDNDRLFGSSAQLTFQASSASYSVSLTLRSVENAFAEPAGQSLAQVGAFGATLRLDAATRTFAPATIAGPNGFTGTIRGQIGGRSNNAALLTFEMTNPAGERIWGVIAADGAQI